jgi:hypothetical protein
MNRLKLKDANGVVLILWRVVRRALRIVSSEGHDMRETEPRPKGMIFLRNNKFTAARYVQTHSRPKSHQPKPEN